MGRCITAMQDGRYKKATIEAQCLIVALLYGARAT